MGKLKNKIKARNEKDWEDKCIRKALNGIGWQKMIQAGEIWYRIRRV